MRFKLLLICLAAMGLLVACAPHRRPFAHARMVAQATPVAVATPAQTPKFTGIYKHLSIAADAPAIDSTLYLNFDGTFKLINDYVGKATITEVGAWQANLDGSATMTTTGQLDKPYDKPVVKQVRFTDDNEATLKVVGDQSSQWTRFEVLVQDYTKETYDPKAATQSIQSRGWADTYKAALPSADCCGLDITLSLNFDHSATFKSDYLNGKAPLVEVGSWTASATQTLTTTAPLTVTVTITGQQGQSPYDKPQALQLALQDGVLVTTQTSTILPDGRLKLYSATGLTAPERAAFAAQDTTEQPPAAPTTSHHQSFKRHLPPWLRLLMRLDQLFHHWLVQHGLSN